jgi:excisionase family DNA binding protein
MNLNHAQLEFDHTTLPSTTERHCVHEPRTTRGSLRAGNPALLPNDDQPLRIKTVAAWLGVADKTVRRRIDSGEIRSVKMGGLRVILRRDLKAYWQKINPTGGSDV